MHDKCHQSRAAFPGVIGTIWYLFVVCALLVIWAAGCSGFRKNDGSSSISNTTPVGQPPGAIKIIVDREGIYQINEKELMELLPGDELADPSLWKLAHQGVTIPFWVVGEEEKRTLTFFGWVTQSKYMNENTYWLTPIENAPVLPGSIEPSRMESLADELTLRVPDGAYLESVHVEENRNYLPQSDGDDHWFWSALVAPKSTQFDISIDSIASGPARLRLSVWASTDAEQNPDHHLRIEVNGNQIADEKWDGKGVFLIEQEFTTDILHEGVNQIVIDMPGDTGAIIDILHANWLELDYSRSPRGIEGKLDFIYPGSPMAFNGFSRPTKVFDITDPEQVIQVDTDLEPSLPFEGQEGRRYLVVGKEGILAPKRIEIGVMSPDLRSPGAGGDYVIVGPQELIDAMQPLIEWREKQGYRVAAIAVSAIYDQFGYGSPEPEAIHAFMQYASKSWQPAPHYLVLLGDASYDPRDYLGNPQANRLPAFMINTEYGGETSSDTGFVQLNDDLWPDLSVGIIPARTPGQVAAYVEKVLAYEAGLPSATKPVGVLAIADGQDVSFRVDAQAFLDLFPSHGDSNVLFAPMAGTSDAQQQIIDLFNQGFSLVAYFGHGSVDMWGKDKLFTAEGVSKLSNLKRYPILLNFTCLTGLYTHPRVDSLAETFLWQPDGGAIAVLAPSSLTLPFDQGYLSSSLAKLLIANPASTIGDLHLQARRQITGDSSGALDVMRTFMLFGDPALRLAGE